MSDWAHGMSGWARLCKFVRARQLSVEWRARPDERLGSWCERLGSWCERLGSSL